MSDHEEDSDDSDASRLSQSRTPMYLGSDDTTEWDDQDFAILPIAPLQNDEESPLESGGGPSVSGDGNSRSESPDVEHQQKRRRLESGAGGGGPSWSCAHSSSSSIDYSVPPYAVGGPSGSGAGGGGPSGSGAGGGGPSVSGDGNSRLESPIPGVDDEDVELSPSL